jgi:hypothetical protein
VVASSLTNEAWKPNGNRRRKIFWFVLLVLARRQTDHMIGVTAEELLAGLFACGETGAGLLDQQSSMWLSL